MEHIEALSQAGDHCAWQGSISKQHPANHVQEQDFIMKVKNEIEELKIKEELDIGPTVIQPAISYQLQIYQEPGPSSRSVDAATSTLSSTFSDETTTQNKSCEEDEGSSLLDVRTDMTPEDTSRDMEESNERDYDIGVQGEYEYKQNASRFKAGIDICKKTYECNYCDYSTETKSDLVRHMCIYHISTHTGVRLYQCRRCSYGAIQYSRLKQHMRSCGKEHIKKELHKCVQCDYCTTTKYNLKAHTCTYGMGESRKSVQCGQSASRPDTLKTHMHSRMEKKSFGKASQVGISKTQKKWYKCEQCEYSACTLSVLKKHMFTHMQEKPYKCDYCPYSASQPWYLKKHMRTHSEEKPYAV